MFTLSFVPDFIRHNIGWNDWTQKKMRSSILQEEPGVEEPIAPVVAAKQEQEEVVVAPVVVEKVDIAPIVAEEVKPEASETAPSAWDRKTTVKTILFKIAEICPITLS